MQLARVDSLKPGQVLGRSLYNERREIELAVGSRLDKDMIDMLSLRRFTYVYIWDTVEADFVTPQDTIGDTIRVANSKSFEQAQQDLRSHEALQKLDPDSIISELKQSIVLHTLLPYTRFEQMAGNVLEEILREDVRLYSSLPVKNSATSDIDHALNVSVISILLGQSLGLSNEHLRQLSTSALLHDAGLWILKSTTQINSEQLADDLIEEHPALSMMMIQKARPDNVVAWKIAHQHHECLDGSGYPEGLRGDDHKIDPSVDPRKYAIHPLSMIVAVANRYDAIVSGRSDGKTHTPEQSLAKLVKDSNLLWNTNVIKELIKIVQLYPMGAHITIKKCSNPQFIGSGGIVIANSPLEPKKPTVILTHDHRGGAIQPKRVVLAREELVELELML
jgi:HD-GYP domain-containing protein (c-di-GMP phosphodiesterase class II)